MAIIDRRDIGRLSIMSSALVCYNCGEALNALTLPISRRDMCPRCSVHLHVCRMCELYDPRVLGQCREEEAEEVREKTQVNFCEWFRPAEGAFDEERASRQARAQAELGSLFGEAGEAGPGAADALLDEAEKLFK